MKKQSSGDNFATVVATLGVLLIGAIMFTLGGCNVNEAKGKAAVEALGMTNVVVGSHPWFSACSADDKYASSFTATGANGKSVSGVICQKGTFFTSLTVRMDG